MTRQTRRLIFYLFVIIFFLATPPIILYAIGYSFDWQKYTIVETGAIALKSTPAGAQIILNGQPQKITPRVISRLKPQNYLVTITRPDFHSWEKTLTVQPGLIVEAKNIFLLPKNPKAEFVAGNVTSTIPYYLSSGEERQKQIRAQNLASTTLGWLLQNDNLFFVQKNNRIVYRGDLSGSVKEQLSQEPLPVSAVYKFFVSPNRKFIAVGDAENNLYLLDQVQGSFKKIFAQAQNALFAGDNKKLAFWSDHEIWVLYLEDIMIQPYKKPGETELITRYAQSISQVIFYPDNEHLAFTLGDQIKIAELDGRDRRNVIDFISTPNPRIYFDEANSNFYYLTKNQLFRIKLD